MPKKIEHGDDDVHTYTNTSKMGSCQSTTRQGDSIIRQSSPYYEDALKSVSPHLYRKTVEILENKHQLTLEIHDSTSSMTLPCGDPYIGQSVLIKGLRFIEVLKKYGKREFTVSQSTPQRYTVHYVQKPESSYPPQEPQRQQIAMASTVPPTLSTHHQQPPITYPRLPPPSNTRMSTIEQYQRDFAGTVASDPISWANNR
jgi:hypothetical protein